MSFFVYIILFLVSNIGNRCKYTNIFDNFNTLRGKQKVFCLVLFSYLYKLTYKKAKRRKRGEKFCWL